MSFVPEASVHRIEFDIPWPPNTAYAYLIDADDPVLVDAGSPGTDGIEALEAAFRAANLRLEDLEHLLITHPHTDHDGQAATLVDAANPTVYALEGVRDRLAQDSETLTSAVRANAMAAGIPNVDEQVDRAVDSLRRNRECLPPEYIDVDVTHGESFEAGGVDFAAIHVPGHQENQAAYLAGSSLFAGDAIVEPFRPAALHVGLDDGCREAVDAFYAGLRALSDIAPSVGRVYPGHGPVFEDIETAIERDRGSLDSVVEDCRRTLAELGEATAYEVTDARIENLQHREYTIFESVGALARLERRGVITSNRDDGVRLYRA